MRFLLQSAYKAKIVKTAQNAGLC